jgi:hypothetical protein
MKRKLTTALLGIALVCLLMAQGCKKKDDPIPETSRVRTLLKANAWKMQSVTVDGTDQATLYAGLTLTFTDTNYSTVKGGGVWPVSGGWTFTDDSAKTIKRSDGLEINILEATATSLKLGLVWSQGTIGPGRVSSVSGNHQFVFVK